MLKATLVVVLVVCALGFTSALSIATKQSSVECTACEWVVKTAEGYISSNQSETYILKELESVCSALVISYLVDACQLVVEEYGPNIINTIVTENPETACAKIGVCTSTKVPVKLSENIKMKSKTA